MHVLLRRVMSQQAEDILLVPTQNSIKECSRLQSLPATISDRSGPTQVSLQLSLPSHPSVPYLILSPDWFSFPPPPCFNLENIPQVKHYPQTGSLKSFLSPCRNRNIFIYIITFANRISNPTRSKEAI